MIWNRRTQSEHLLDSLIRTSFRTVLVPAVAIFLLLVVHCTLKPGKASAPGDIQTGQAHRDMSHRQNQLKLTLTFPSSS